MILFLLGCLSYEDGQVQRGELNCELLDVCGELDGLGFDSVDACAESAASQNYDEDACANYSASQMKACIHAYEDAVVSEDCEADLVDVCQVCG